MKPLHSTQLASWLIVGLTLAPLVGAEVERQRESSAEERLTQLLTSHDVRNAIHAPLSGAGSCADEKDGQHR